MNSLIHMRLWGMIRKESLQILRDPSSISIAFVMPVVLLFLFGYGVSLDAKHIPVGIVIEQPDMATQSLAGAFERSEFFRPLHFNAIQPVKPIVPPEADVADGRRGGEFEGVGTRFDDVRRVCNSGKWDPHNLLDNIF